MAQVDAQRAAQAPVEAAGVGGRGVGVAQHAWREEPEISERAVVGHGKNLRRKPPAALLQHECNASVSGPG